MRTLSAPPTGSRCKRWTPRTSPWWRWCYEAPVLTTTDATETWPWGWTCWTWCVSYISLSVHRSRSFRWSRDATDTRRPRCIEESLLLWFPNEQKSHIFEFFQCNPIFFLSLLRVRETTGAAKERERSSRRTRRRRLVVCAMKVKMRESDRRKQGQLFPSFCFWEITF